MKTLSLNIDQIRAIFGAGVRRGIEEANAFEWGSYAQGDHHDNLVEALAETGLITWDAAKLWVKEPTNEN